MEDKKDAFILWFKDLRLEDTPLVGGKNAALGEMYSNLTPLGVDVPQGFALTAKAYEYFLEFNNLKEKIRETLKGLNTKDVRDLQKRGAKIRKLIRSGKFPQDLAEEIKEAYLKLSKEYGEEATDVAVRSSATAEDLPGASFAGQQETYLNVVGFEKLLEAIKNCMASLFTDRAISYREDKGFDHFKVALSVGVQKMVRSDLASSGVAFTIDTETGLDKVIIITATYGLGELIVQGKVVPDEWMVFKEGLKKGYKAIFSRKLGKKENKIVYSSKGGTKLVKVPLEDQKQFALTDEEVLLLANWCQKIEDHFSKLHQRLQPMDIEWAKDGKTGKLFIVQARPETVYSAKKPTEWKEYKLKEKGKVILEGIAVGSKIAVGKVRVIKDVSKISEFKPGEILVTEITDPDWEPIMKIAKGIITDKGGRTSHAAIVSRELGIPAIVGTQKATKVLKTGQEITLDCSSGNVGKVYQGKLKFEEIVHDLGKLPETKTQIKVNIGSPEEAFKNHWLPVKGVGLAREEFIIASYIKIHPNALLDYPKLKERAKRDKKIKEIVEKIDQLTEGYEDKSQYYVDKLAEGIAKIAVAFWPYEVMLRFSDFKTNEYKNLIGGELYEPKEENPMLGWRGASRYYHPDFKSAFELELLALKKVREEFGLVNVMPFIPFCRTVEELQKVLAIFEDLGLERDALHNQTCSKLPLECNHLKIYLMCEIPSNVILADEFLEYVDGYSIGSNDLTQLTLGIDRDSELVANVGNELNDAVKSLISQVIKKCKEKGKSSGICGQAPSDYPEFAEFLVKEGIDSMSLNPDVVIKTIELVAKVENKLKNED